MAYCIAKDGILGFTKALALEVASQCITVNAICPTWVDTAMARQGIEETAASHGVSPDEIWKVAISTIPIKRMAAAEEVASLVLYLCSQAASAITGQALMFVVELLQALYKRIRGVIFLVLATNE